MKTRFLPSFIALIGISLLLAATPSVANSPHAKGYSKIMRMAEAMGGIDRIHSLAGQRLVASGERHEPEQSFRPGGEAIHLADYEHVLVQAFGARQTRSEWSIDTLYPTPALRHFTEIINGEHAAVIGVDSILGIPQAPMLATRMGARTKQYLVSSPLAMIHHALANPKAVSFLGTEKLNGRPHHVVSIPAWEQNLQLYIDVVTGLPSQVETLEDDSVYGDALWRVRFKDWRQVNGVRVPTRLLHSLQGRRIHTVTLSSIELLDRLDSNLFVVPEELKAEFAPQLFAWGTRSSQWYGRYLPTGIPFDLDQSTAASVTLVDIAPGVVHVLGLTHNTMVVEMQDYLVAIEPPLYDQRTQAVLSAIKQRWPHKPIKYIVASHFHNDHIGGIRGYAAIGATLIVGADTQAHHESVLAAPHTVYPDALALQPRVANIIGVTADKPYFISDGKRTIRLFDLPNRHAIGMLVPYIEDAKLVFVSDLYNPELFPVPLPPLFSFWSFDLLAGLEDSGLAIDWLAGAHGSVVSYERFVSDVQASY